MTDKSSHELARLLSIVELEENNPEVEEWLSTVSASSFGLVGSLVEVIKDVSATIEAKNQALHILRKLNFLLNEVILPQLKDSEGFTDALFKYIEETPVSSLSHEAFLLVADILKEQAYPVLMREDVLKVLFDSLEFIQEVRVFHGVVAVLVNIGNEPGNNLKYYCMTHPSARYFEETLLQILNRSDATLREKCLNCIKGFLDDPQVSEAFFYSTDLKNLCELIVKHIEIDTNDSQVPIDLDILISMLDNSEFFASQYMFEELSDLMEYLERAENPDIAEKAKEVKHKIESAN